MSGLEIPDRARHNALEVLIDHLDPIEVAVTTCDEMLEAAAPIIVAAELRRLAAGFERRADSCLLHRDGRGQEQRVTLLKCADEARQEADEMDPGGSS